MSAQRESRLQRRVLQVWLVIGVLVLAWAFWQVLARPLAALLGPLLVAALLVILLGPIVRVLAERGWNRWLSTAWLYLLLLGVTVLTVIVAVPLVATQLEELLLELPALGDALVGLALQVEDLVGFDLGLEGESVAADLSTVSQALLAEQEVQDALRRALGGLVGAASGLLTIATAFLVGPALAFYVLGDLPGISRRTLRLLPPSRRAEAAGLVAGIHRVVVGFVRGQLLLSVFVGVVITIGLAVIGLPYWLVIGILAGVTNLVPFLGPIVGGTAAVTVALATGGVGQAVVVLVFVLVVQQVESHVVAPPLVGRNVAVPPPVVLLAVFVGVPLFGLVGLLLAVPVAASLKLLAVHLWSTRVPWANEVDESDEGPEGSASVVPLPTEPVPEEAGRPGGGPEGDASGEAGKPGEGPDGDAAVMPSPTESAPGEGPVETPRSTGPSG